jgi:uncharacterized alkaline shock family protein YloU
LDIVVPSFVFRGGGTALVSAKPSEDSIGGIPGKDAAHGGAGGPAARHGKARTRAVARFAILLQSSVQRTYQTLQGGHAMAPELRGTVTIANDVLADIAGFVALECYGVVGMASPSLREGVAQLLSRDKLRKGVLISNTDERSVIVDLYVVVEHGTNLTQVSRNLSNRVRYALTHDADVQVADVRVHVQGIKVRKKTERA